MTHTLSLCSGYGGLDLAVEHALGAVTVAHAEVDDAPSRVLAARWPGVPNLGDLTAIDWTHVAADVFTAGYPCQPFSLGGKRKGTADARHLWPRIAEGIRRVRPRLVVLENVAGHRSMGLDAVLGDLAALGYDACWTSLRAADVGAPHGRERLFIAAADADEQGRQGTEPAGRHDLSARGAAADPHGYALRVEPVTEPGGGSSSVARLTRPYTVVADTYDDAAWAGREPRHATGSWTEPAQRGAAATPDAHDGEPPVEEGTDTAALVRAGAGASAGNRARRDAPGTAWGAYEPAIRRWERALDRVAPAPTETGPKGGQRLSPAFVEWLMGLPAGWVTDIPGISRNAQLKMLGNGVVPQQAIAALAVLLPQLQDVAA